MSDVGLRLLEREEIGVAGELAARAFFEDPGMRFFFPDPERRRKVLPSFLGTLIRYGLEFGQVLTTHGPPRGLAVIIPPPGRAAITYPRMARVGMFRQLPALGLPTIARLLTFGTYADWLDPMAFRTWHWYLWLLAVDPAEQGKGLGGALLQAFSELAEKDRIPAHLETSTEQNVRFYEHHGYRISRGGKAPFGGPQIWTMHRNPGATE